MPEPRRPRPPRAAPSQRDAPGSRPARRTSASSRERASDGRPREGRADRAPQGGQAGRARNAGERNGRGRSGGGGGDVPPGSSRSGGRPPRRLPVGGGALAGLVAVGVVLLLLIVALGVKATHSGKALPGTEVAGVDVGGADADTIRERLRPVVTGNRTLLLRADGKLLRVKLSDAGYEVDLDATVQGALDAGRGGFLAGLPGTLAGLVGSRSAPVESDVDADGLRKALSRVADQVGRKPFAGSISVDPDTRRVATKDARAGQRVDRDALATRIRRELMAGDRGPIDVPLTSVPAVSAERLDALADEARDYAARPLRLTGAGSPLELGPGEVAKLLALQSQDGGRKAQLGVAGSQLTALLDRVQKRGAREARSARISTPAASTTLTEKGSVSWRPRRASVTSGTARTGRAVQRDKLASAIRAAVADGTHTVRVPVVTTQPAVSTAAAKRVGWLLGSFTTPYVAGQPRVENIQRMARTVDGTVIPAGGTFSLNGITGERTKAKGYVEAPFIAGNKIEPSVGGGVSQFSTTTYNAAYFAGLQIDAHQAHSLYIDRYPPGRESTLNFPDIDLKWTNDTDTPVVVRTSYDDAGVTVSLYGDNGQRRVRATAGDREAADGGDFQITVTRTITYADGHSVKQPVTTRYENEQEGSSE